MQRHRVIMQTIYLKKKNLQMKLHTRLFDEWSNLNRVRRCQILIEYIIQIIWK